MEFLRHLKQGGRIFPLLLLLMLGIVILLFSQKTKGQILVDDRIPSDAAKAALEGELEELIGAMEGIGAVRVRVTLDRGNEYVFDNGKNTLVLSGRVRGVAVVCDGGDNAVNREKIISLLCALLDLPMRSVSVSQ